MWETIAGWQAEGRTIVLTTHYMEEAEELCDRVAVMDAGKIITLNSPEALIEELLGRGFHRDHEVRAATLEDVLFGSHRPLVEGILSWPHVLKFT